MVARFIYSAVKQETACSDGLAPTRIKVSVDLMLEGEW